MMKHFTIDSFIFAVFLLINLILGLRAGRKVKTLRDYAIGNKDFSTGVLASTIAATWIGGGFMFYALQNIYNSGLLFIIPLLGSTICLIMTGQILATRMVGFFNNLSVAEAMGSLYGPTVRVITATSGILSNIGYLALQFQAMSRILTFLFDVESVTATLIAAGIAIFYSAFGGLRSVSTTEVLQFIIFSIFIIVLGFVVWKQIKDPAQVIDTLTTNPLFNIKKIIEWKPPLLTALALMLYYTIPGLSPSIFQRIPMGKDLTQIKRSFTYAGGIDLLVTLSITWIAILLLSDNSNLDLESNQLINYIVNSYAYPGLKGLIAMGITAKAMSTASSELNTAAVLAVNDIIKPLTKDFKESLTIIRLFTLVLGLLGLLLALHTTDLLDLLLFSGSFWMPIVTVPLLLAIFGFCSSSKAVLTGMSAGFIAVCLGRPFKILGGIDPLIPGMIANFVCYVGSHYILVRFGMGGNKVIDTEPTWTRAIKQTRLYRYVQTGLTAHSIVYSLLGIYTIEATCTAFLCFKDYQTLYFFIAFTLLTVILMVLYEHRGKQKD